MPKVQNLRRFICAAICLFIVAMFYACNMENPYFAFTKAAENGNIAYIMVYTVTFDANGGSWDGDTQALPKNTGPESTVAGNMPSAPSYDGYYLACWKTVREGGGTDTVFDGSTPVDHNITVYAQWMPEGDAGSL
jgi:hypothetical protein